MKKTTAIIFSGFLLFSFIQMPKELDDIKAFKPDDKYFKTSLINLHFITEISAIDKVDAAFKERLERYNLPVNAKGCADGIYTAASPYDAYDYKHIIELKIKNEKIIAADYNEVKYNGPGKQEDSLYCKEMSISGTTPAIAYPKMENQLIETQDLMQVDAVSGATYSLYRFRYAGSIALIRARLARQNNK